MLCIVLIVVLMLMLLGSMPVWTFNSGWGYYPVGGLSIALVVLVLFLFRGNSRV